MYKRKLLVVEQIFSDHKKESEKFLLFVAWPQDGKKIYSVDTHKKCAEKE